MSPNIQEVEEAIRRAVELAERPPPCNSNRLLSPSPPDVSASETFKASVEVAGSKVTDGAIARVLGAGSRHSARDGRVLMHSLPIGYSVDGARGVRDPRGHAGAPFGVDMHVATCDLATASQPDARDREDAISRSRPWWRAPIRPGLRSWPTTRPISAQRWSIWGQGPPPSRCFRAAGSSMPTASPLAGQHVTMDLARGLNARIADAERIKTFYGTVRPVGTMSAT